MQELEVTWARALRVWWSVLWRWVLIGLPALFFTGAALGLVLVVLERPIEASILQLQVLGGVLGAVMSVWIFRTVLSKSFGTFRIVLVPIAPTTEVSAGRTRLVALSLIVIAAVGGLLLIQREEGPQLDSELRVASEVREGETLQLVVSLSNPHSHPVTLDSIDVDDDLLVGFEVLDVEPDPTRTWAIPFVEQRSWSFGRQVPASGRMEVTFHLEPIEAGHFVGNVEVCNPEQDCAGHVVDVAVRTAEGRKDEKKAAAHFRRG